MLDELRAAALGDQDLVLGERPPEERVVDGSQLRALCLELDAAGARALTLVGADVAGRLDLAATTLKLWLSFKDCEFDESLLLSSARLAGLSLERCRVPSLVADRLTVDAELELSQSTVRETRRSSSPGSAASSPTAPCSAPTRRARRCFSTARRSRATST